MKKNVLKLTAIAIVALVTLTCAFALSACDEKRTDVFEQNTKFYLDNDTLYFMGQPDILVSLVESVAINMDETYFEFRTDGTVHMQVTTKDGLFRNVNDLLEGYGIDLGFLTSMNLQDSIDAYVEPMFPGFDERISEGDLEGALKLIRNSLGFDITGLDYENDGVKEVLAYVGAYKSLPSDIFAKIPTDTVLRLTFDSTYDLRTVKGADGKEYTAIYISDIKNNPSTQPFGVFTVKEDNGVKKATLRIEFMDITVGVKTN